MKKDILFTLPSYFRDDMNIMAYRFGKGEKTCAVVGALRGDEVQQLYVCARLVSFLREVEKEDGIQPGKSVMIVPTAIGASLAGAEIFPDMLVQMVGIGEESGSIDAMLEKTADFYDDEVETMSSQLTALLEPLMLVFMGALLGFMIVALYLPMFMIFQSIQNL